MYSVSSLLSSFHKSSYFIEKKRNEFVLEFQIVIREPLTWNKVANLTVWYYCLHMYSDSRWLPESQKSSYYNEKTRIDLVFRVSKTNSRTSSIAIILHIWLFGIIIYTCIVFRGDSHQVRIKLIQRKNENWACLQSFKKWIENLSNCNNVADLTLWHYNLHMYSVSSFSHKVRNQAISKRKRELILFLEFPIKNREPLQLQ